MATFMDCSRATRHRDEEIPDIGETELYQRIANLARKLSPAQKQVLLQKATIYAASVQPPDSTEEQTIQLSNREKEVLVLVSSGYSRRDIGKSLGISINTAARHIANIYQKLDISSVAEATRYAMTNSFLTSTET